MEDGEAVAYIKSSGIWIRMSTGQTPEDYADSVSSVALDGSNVAIDKTVTELNGKAVICLTTQLTGQNMRPVLSGVLNNFGSAFADSSAIAGADYSSVICDSRIYLDKETYLPISYEVNFTGVNRIMETVLLRFVRVRALLILCLLPDLSWLKRTTITYTSSVMITGK